MPGVSTFYTFYDDVRVPVSSIVARENEGWRLITTQLNFERAALGNMGALEPLFEKTLHWARTTELDDGRVVDQPWVRQALARVEAQVGAYKIMNLRVNAAMTKGALGMGEASAVKVFGTELTQQVARELLEVLDRAGTRKGEDAPLRGALESAYRIAVINTFGGGANELQRDIIAMAGLFKPRAPRDLRAAATQNGDASTPGNQTNSATTTHSVMASRGSSGSTSDQSPHQSPSQYSTSSSSGQNSIDQQWQSNHDSVSTPPTWNRNDYYWFTHRLDDDDRRWTRDHDSDDRSSSGRGDNSESSNGQSSDSHSTGSNESGVRSNNSTGAADLRSGCTTSGGALIDFRSGVSTARSSSRSGWASSSRCTRSSCPAPSPPH